MPNPKKEPSLFLLAIIGLALYLGVTMITPFLQGAAPLENEGPDLPVLSEMEVRETAEKFALKQWSLSSSRQVHVMYQSYTGRSGYVQKEKLYDTYVQRYGDRYPLDYYQVEIDDLNSGDAYYIDVNYTSGRIIGWQRYGSRAAAATGAGSADEAARLAEKTLRDMDYAPEAFDRTDASDPAKGAYVYRSRTERIGEAPLELVVQVAGGQVDAFHPRFAVPQSFLAWQQAQDDRAALMTRFSMGASLALAVAAVVVMIRYRREISFAKGAVLALIFLAVYLINNFNMLPALRTSHGEGPSEGYAIFYLWFMNIFVTLLAVSAYLALSAGRKLWLNHGVTAWPSWRSPGFGKHVRTAMVRGYLLCLFVLGVQQTLFLIAGEAFDVWAVNDPGDSVYNMRLPEVFPLMAWAAAISEEAIYRLLGIALFLRLTRSRVLAVLLPSVIWAMSHTQYPIYPVYTRLIEVTILGLIFGYAFLRYGFVTALFAHAAMDSVLMGLSLMYMGEPRQVLVGALYLLVPALVGWLLAWVHGRIKPRLPSPPPLPPPLPPPAP